MDYRIQVVGQLSDHLKSLRQSRGLTQADLGRLIGVRQVRVAAIEANPGSVGVEQFVRIMNALRVAIILRTAEEPVVPAASKSSKPNSTAGTKLRTGAKKRSRKSIPSVW